MKKKIFQYIAKRLLTLFENRARMGNVESKFYSHVICLDLLKQGFMPKSEAPTGASFFAKKEKTWHFGLC